MKGRTENEHPALGSAKRAIRRRLRVLSAEDVFVLASLAEQMATGADRALWSSSATYAALHPEMFEPTRNGGA